MAGHETTLFSLSTPIISYVLGLRESNELERMEPAVLRRELVQRLQHYRQDVRGCHDSVDDINKAEFVLVTSIDEFITSCQWPGQHEYANHTLCLEVFDRTDTGKGFFQNLAYLCKAPEEHRGVLEVYLTCLALGYRGELAFRDQTLDTEVRSLMGEIARGLRIVSAPDAERLTQDAYPVVEHIPRISVRPWKVWLIAVAASLLIVAGFIGAAHYKAGRITNDIRLEVLR